MAKRKPTTTCPTCNTPRFKNELTQQTVTLIITHKDGIKETRRYKRITCITCNKSEWISREGLIIRDGFKLK